MVVKCSFGSSNPCFVVKAKINSFPDCNYISSWTNPLLSTTAFPLTIKTHSLLSIVSPRMFFSLLNINWIQRSQSLNHMILRVPSLTFVQSNTHLLCCWALPMLHTSESNLRKERQSGNSAGCPRPAGVPFSTISQVPHYLLWFHDFILRKQGP